jgi:hypothetical protein
MTIEHIMLLASVAQTPRDWAEVRAAIVALLDAEAEACAGIVDDTVRAVDAADALAAIRARIAARKGGAKP